MLRPMPAPACPAAQGTSQGRRRRRLLHAEWRLDWQWLAAILEARSRLAEGGGVTVLPTVTRSPSGGDVHARLGGRRVCASRHRRGCYSSGPRRVLAQVSPALVAPHLTVAPIGWPRARRFSVRPLWPAVSRSRALVGCWYSSVVLRAMASMRARAHSSPFGLVGMRTCRGQPLQMVQRCRCPCRSSSTMRRSPRPTLSCSSAAPPRAVRILVPLGFGGSRVLLGPPRREAFSGRHSCIGAPRLLHSMRRMCACVRERRPRAHI